MATSFFWNDAPLRAAVAAKARASFTAAAGVARARCPWAHVAGSIFPEIAGTTANIVAKAPDALLCEFGASPHEIAPHGTALKFEGGDGGFVQFPVAHPGFSGTPYLQTAAAAWPSLFGAGGLTGFGFV